MVNSTWYIDDLNNKRKKKKKNWTQRIWLAVNPSTITLRLANVFATTQEVCHTGHGKCADKNEFVRECMHVCLCVRARSVFTRLWHRDRSANVLHGMCMCGMVWRARVRVAHAVQTSERHLLNYNIGKNRWMDFNFD